MASSKDILDVLVAGGGPAGTATAFRASELGLSVLVIDYDDLMKRIRDYSKDKLILPSFGGGDKMAFPAGGDLISSLCFAPIDKDDLCQRFKSSYKEHGVESMAGLELTGLETQPDGIWKVKTWDHNERRDRDFLARHVVIGIGRGVPRRFDIPGNTDGIAFRLTDPAHYIGEAVCVVGGGTSAAEAVMSISRAKVAAADDSEVYWSYRGDKMPRVSKALAEAFFETYVGNGNIRYYRRSEPVAIVSGDDKDEYLSIRVDRRALSGRPIETSHLEFRKTNCIACIGEDLPEELLRGFGVERVEGGPKGKKRMVVNRFLETVRPNVFMVGDLLSQAYLETDDFSADPAGFREVTHRGNIKSALRDGVLVAQVIRQRLDGVQEIDCRVEDGIEELKGSSAIAVISGIQDLRGLSHGAAGACLVQVLPDGVQGQEYPLRTGGTTTIGRTGCAISFPDDSLLSPTHAAIEWSDDGALLRDEGAVTGVFLQAPAGEKVEVGPGSLISVGRQFLVVQDSEIPVLIHYDAAGQEIAQLEITASPLVVGRDAPGAVLDPRDMGLSRRHFSVSYEKGQVLIKDLKSMNGTYIRVADPTPLRHGSRFRVGAQLFAVRLDPEAILDTSPPPPARRSSLDLAAVKPPVGEATDADAPLVVSSGEAPSGDGPTVSFAGKGAFAVPSGDTICDVAEENSVGIVAECHSGICGSDPVRILSGRENVLNEPGDQESETLEDLCDLVPGECRLACMLKVKGPIEVEIIKD